MGFIVLRWFSETDIYYLGRDGSKGRSLILLVDFPSVVDSFSDSYLRLLVQIDCFDSLPRLLQMVQTIAVFPLLNTVALVPLVKKHRQD